MPEISKTEGKIEIVFDPEERNVFVDLLDQMEAMLSGGLTRTDPAIERLFPRAYQDPDEQTAYEDLTQSALVAGKLEAISGLRDVLAPMSDGNAYVVLDDESRDSFLALLTDIRLTLGTRIGVDAEMISAEHDPRDPATAPLIVFEWLGWIQGTVLERMGY
jgi:hypothetical protein